jgi:hypothetical protein
MKRLDAPRGEPLQCGGGTGNAVQREMGMDDAPAAGAQESPRKARRRAILIAIAGLLIAGIGLAAIIFRPKPTHDQIAGPPVLLADARELKSTIVTPLLEEPIVPGKNILWCSTFQLAWNEGCRAAGGDIRLDAELPMVPILNKKTAKETDLDPDSYLVISGMVDANLISRMVHDLDRKFKGQASPDLLHKVTRQIAAKAVANSWMAYSYLFRELPFEHDFERLKHPFAFGPAQVASFGLCGDTREWSEKAEQVAVLDYKSDDDFILALRPKEKGERILLAKIAPAETIEKTISDIRKRIADASAKEGPSELSRKEPLAIPILNFDVSREYAELEGKTITTPGPLEGMEISLALQAIRFRLDEHGAVLKSEAALSPAACKAAEPKPRQFIFDKPFLILLERTDAAQPYFALRVDNAELLAPYH